MNEEQDSSPGTSMNSTATTLGNQTKPAPNTSENGDVTEKDGMVLGQAMAKQVKKWKEELARERKKTQYLEKTVQKSRKEGTKRDQADIDHKAQAAATRKKTKHTMVGSEGTVLFSLFINKLICDFGLVF